MKNNKQVYCRSLLKCPNKDLIDEYCGLSKAGIVLVIRRLCFLKVTKYDLNQKVCPLDFVKHVNNIKNTIYLHQL